MTNKVVQDAATGPVYIDLRRPHLILELRQRPSMTHLLLDGKEMIYRPGKLAAEG